LKRDMRLLRLIVLERDTGGYTAEAVGYHVFMLGEARLARVIETTQLSQSPQAVLVALTQEGHDFADRASSDDAWDYATDLIARVGGRAPFEVWQEALKSWAIRQYQGGRY